MSKKARKSRHRVPSSAFTNPEPITPEYQAEIDRSMANLAREYEKARKATEAAGRRKERARRNAERAEEQRLNATQRRKAEAEYERRLREYEEAQAEFNRWKLTMESPPVRDRSTKGERVFLTGGRENPRARTEVPTKE